MRQYQKASENPDYMEEKLSPLLQRLRRENRYLRDKANKLQAQLDAVEKNVNEKKVDKVLNNYHFFLIFKMVIDACNFLNCCLTFFNCLSSLWFFFEEVYQCNTCYFTKQESSDGRYNNTNFC